METQHSPTGKHLVGGETALQKAETLEQTPTLGGTPSALTGWVKIAVIITATEIVLLLIIVVHTGTIVL